MLSLDICLSALFYFCILIFIIFMQCTNFYIMVILALCEAYPRPFQLPIYLTDKSLEDEKELSSYTKGSQSILYISVLIAAVHSLLLSSTWGLRCRRQECLHASFERENIFHGLCFSK
jgi:hypothetical protein